MVPFSFQIHNQFIFLFFYLLIYHESFEFYSAPDLCVKNVIDILLFENKGKLLLFLNDKIIKTKTRAHNNMFKSSDSFVFHKI